MSNHARKKWGVKIAPVFRTPCRLNSPVINTVKDLTHMLHTSSSSASNCIFSKGSPVAHGKANCLFTPISTALPTLTATIGMSGGMSSCWGWREFFMNITVCTGTCNFDKCQRLLVKHWIVIAYAESCCLLPQQTPYNL